MSPVSRGRKGKKNRGTGRGTGTRPAGGASVRELFGPPEACDCPVCSGEAFNLNQLVDQLMEGTGALLEMRDPLDVELAGAAFSMLADEATDDMLADGLLPVVEARARPEALAVLLALGSVVLGRTGAVAAAAAGRLAEAGVARPGWADELASPVVATDCRRLGDPNGVGSMLICTFRRAGRGHTMMTVVDHTDCGAASNILLMEADQGPDPVALLRSQFGDRFIEETLEPAEFRWQLENALDARAHHDRDDASLDADEDEDEPDDYPIMAALLRARLRALPASDKPAAPHSAGGPAGLPDLKRLRALLAGTVDPDTARPTGRPARSARRERLPKLPAKRKRSDPPAPIYQIKVGLRGATPPIWRRLEVPSDITLATLHDVIQVAFGWDDSHLHVFETSYGDFGVDAELGHRDEDRATLEQVAPTVRSKISYCYDFGDDWRHDILVEQVRDPDTATAYPRCTGGRRAAPPEDCGGVGGYQHLLDVLLDPSDPDHEDRMEWLGLDSPDDFDPTRFDRAAITEALAQLRPARPVPGRRG